MSDKARHYTIAAIAILFAASVLFTDIYAPISDLLGR